jgi:hypothetical protein
LVLVFSEALARYSISGDLWTACLGMVVTAVEDISGFILLLSIMHELLLVLCDNFIYDESKEQYCKIPEFDVVFSLYMYEPCPKSVRWKP